MRKLMSGLLAGTLAVSLAAAAAVPANAASIYVPQNSAVNSDVQNVDWKPWMRHGGPHFSRHNGPIYWNGHRGYREWHPGYRRHGDYWFPLAAFATGALITGAIVNSENRAAMGDAHVRWCYDHYRSYQASDNTWQPNHGPRRQCVSPY
jgi:hypothetical protein